MKKLYIIFALLVQGLLSSAQVKFQTAYGDTMTDIGKVIISTSNGGYCIAGVSGSNYIDSSDISLFLLDSMGNLVLSAKIGMVGDEFPTGLVENSNGEFIVSGTTYASPMDTAHADIFALKVDPSLSNIIWANVYGGSGDDEAQSLLMTPEGNYVISGSTKSFGSVSRSALAIKIDDNGDKIWSNINHIGTESFFNSADMTADNKYVFCGGAFNGSDYDHYIMKMDTNGSMSWGKRYGSTGAEWGYDIKTTSDHGFLLGGITTFNTAGDTDQSVMKLDSSGTIDWVNDYGTIDYDRASSVLEDPSHNYIVFGYSNLVTDVGTANQLVLEQIDHSGNVVWANSYGSPGQLSEGYSLIQGLDGGFAACGYSVAISDPNGDVYMIKTNGIGVSGCFELPDTVIKHSTTMQVNTGASDSLININMMQIFPPIMPFVNQFIQNCTDDNVATIKDDNSLKIYPDPARHSLFIETKESGSMMTFTDITGRTVFQQLSTSEKSMVDVTSFRPGIYFVIVASKSGSVKSKFIKE